MITEIETLVQAAKNTKEAMKKYSVLNKKINQDINNLRLKSIKNDCLFATLMDTNFPGWRHLI